MRSLDVCKAEIFRRSAEKIKRRKKTRNRILIACVPLCLCLSLGAADVFFSGIAAKGENMAQAPESAGWNGFMDLEENETAADSCATSSEASQSDPSEPLAGESSQLIVREEAFLSEERMQDHETAKAILLNLEYSPHKLCKCLPQYILKTDFGEFGIHLSEGYARCEEGQADLTAEQVETLREIIERLKININ